jgi:hypothetical protein
MNASGRFLPAFFPRLFAAGCVFLLISTLSLTCILGIAFIGPGMSHGTQVNHAAGQIISLGPDKSFVLLTANGERLPFLCGTNCRASLGHMQRHLNEHAHTDVYYIEGPNQELMALDVD